MRAGFRSGSVFECAHAPKRDVIPTRPGFFCVPPHCWPAARQLLPPRQPRQPLKRPVLPAFPPVFTPPQTNMFLWVHGPFPARFCLLRAFKSPSPVKTQRKHIGTTSRLGTATAPGAPRCHACARRLSRCFLGSHGHSGTGCATTSGSGCQRGSARRCGGACVRRGGACIASCVFHSRLHLRARPGTTDTQSRALAPPRPKPAQNAAPRDEARPGQGMPTAASGQHRALIHRDKTAPSGQHRALSGQGRRLSGQHHPLSGQGRRLSGQHRP